MTQNETTPAKEHINENRDEILKASQKNSKLYMRDKEEKIKYG